MTDSTKATFLATVRPRIGVVFDRALFYATGGVAIGTVKTNLHRARKELADAMRAAGWAPAPRADEAETPRGAEP